MPAAVQALMAAAVLGPRTKHWELLLAPGIPMIVLGMLEVYQPLACTAATTIVFGALLLVKHSSFDRLCWIGPRGVQLRCALAVLIVGVMAPPVTFAQTQLPEDHWTFSITPYLWLPNINGALNYSTPAGGTASPSVSVGADSYLSDLKAGLLLAGVATKGRWAIGTDIIYMKFDSEQSQVKGVNFTSTGRDPVSASLNAGTNSALEALVWTVDGSYSLLQKHPGALDLVGGVRYLGVDTSTDWNLTATITGPGGTHTFPRSGSISERLDLWDGIVGLRGRIPLGQSHWSVSYYGDIGAGTESSTTYQWLIGINYDWRWGGLVLAYRELQYDQGGDRLLQDVRFSGPALGITFRF